MLTGNTNESALYPLEKTKACTFCREQITLHRQGDGRRTMGLLNYWYESDHACAAKRRFASGISFDKKKVADSRSKAIA